MPMPSEHERALEWLSREVQPLPRQEALAFLAYLEQQAKARSDLGCLRVVREVRNSLPSTPPLSSA